MKYIEDTDDRIEVEHSVQINEEVELEPGDIVRIVKEDEKKSEAAPITENVKGLSPKVLREMLQELEERSDVELIVNQTYEIVTPESAEVGDAEDRGFDFEETPYGPYELLRHVESEGFAELSTYPVELPLDDEYLETIWIMTYPEEDYSTDETETKSLHLSRGDNPDMLERFCWAAILTIARQM